MRKKIVFGLFLMVSWQASAQDSTENYWGSRMASSGLQIATAYMLPNYGVGPDIKWGLYFSAGMENPWKTACLLVSVGVWGQDPAALSAAFSLFNRGMAITTLHEGGGLPKWMAFGEVAFLDLAVGQIPGCQKFRETKWMGALGNSLEQILGPLAAGTMFALVPLTGSFGDTASSEFSEESGMRVTPALFDWLAVSGSLEHTATSAIIAASSYWLTHQLRPQRKLVAAWTSAAAMSFMLNALITGTRWLHQTLDA